MGKFDEDCLDEMSRRGEGCLGQGRTVVIVGDQIPEENDSIEMEEEPSMVVTDASVKARMERKFERMMEGRKTFSNLRTPDKPPPWLDKEVSRCVFIWTVNLVNLLNG